ncbi:MAG: HAD family hydrolase [Thermoplasmatota archaeon]
MDKEFELVVFDMDGVLVDVESSWVWVHKHFNVNNDHSLKKYLRGEIDDLEFIRRDIELWRNKDDELDKDDIKSILRDVPLMKGYSKCLHRLNKKRYKTAIISGGLKPLAEEIGAEYFDIIKANDVEEIDGELSGEGILEVKLNDKGTVFDELLGDLDIEHKDCIAVGNSFIDAPMLEKAGLGIAFDPADSKVRKAADIVIEEKNLCRILEHL